MKCNAATQTKINDVPVFNNQKQLETNGVKGTPKVG